ncbi:MAG TPA: membrane protein insertion efficiency factor YidD [Thermoguttaceae bacterium]|nr:membrane protein insertion efficiency factor YidD [Thermoguttaceae bacterium]
MSRLRSLAAFLATLPGRAVIRLVRLYQTWISPMIGPHCRFEPTCSEYFVLAVRKYGAFRGTAKGLWRICRCNPWNSGGDDPP